MENSKKSIIFVVEKIQDMRNTNNQIMFDCFTSSHSVYFEEAYDADFRKQYKGVIVNAHNEGGYGHFAIRKPHTIWSKLPKFIKKMFHYEWIMWKGETEKMYGLHFNNLNNSITICGNIKNDSARWMKFDKKTYEDLRDCIPAFLKHVGYEFETTTDKDSVTLVFDKEWFNY